MNLYGVILAGGGGTRLWPLSRQRKPKPLLNLLGERSMLQDTVARLAPLIEPDRLFVAVNAVHAPEVARQLPEVPAHHIVVEPVARETGPALGLAAVHLVHHDPDAILASFQADHVVLQPETLRAAVALAARAAEDGAIATIGITPTFAATGYGYIELAGTMREEDGLCVREAVRFVEKPQRETAEAYLATGNFVWNAGLFICKVQTLLDAFATHVPDVYAGLMQIKAAIGTDSYVETLEAVFPTLQKISIDVGIMEKFHPLVTVPCDPGWNDVGDWDTLASLIPGDEHGNVTVGATHLAIETKRTLVHGYERLVTTIGVEDLIIVDTPDALLVMPRSRAQDVKKLVEQLNSHH
jgi:mannose-1-phosphate guanylyltransferase